MSLATRAPFVLIALLSLAACSGGSDSPSAPTPSTPPPAGVPFSSTDLTVGTGVQAVAGRRLTVAYSGWLYDSTAADNKGTLFDSSSAAGPFTFVLGAGQVIRGWDQGVPGMRVGGRRRLVIPPDLAYGSQGRGLIPPNATLVFEVELLSVS